MPSFHIPTPYFLWEQGTGLERINWDNCVLRGCRSRIPPLFTSLFHLAFLFCVRNGQKSSTPFLPRHQWLRPNFLWAFYLDPKFFCEQENRHISQAAISLFWAAFQKGGEGEPRDGDNCFYRGCCSRISPLFISFSHSSFKRGKFHCFHLGQHSLTSLSWPLPSSSCSSSTQTKPEPGLQAQKDS